MTWPTRLDKPGCADAISSTVHAAERFGPTWTGGDLMFTGEDGQPLHPDCPVEGSNAASVAGLPPIRFHDLRHTFTIPALEHDAAHDR